MNYWKDSLEKTGYAVFHGSRADKEDTKKLNEKEKKTLLVSLSDVEEKEA